MSTTAKLMRAKFYCSTIQKSDEGHTGDPYENLGFSPVVGDGSTENDSFSKHTPNGSISLTVTNPDLLGKVSVGDQFYIDFIPVTKKG